jgi:hypothetical protein
MVFTILGVLNKANVSFGWSIEKLYVALNLGSSKHGLKYERIRLISKI